MKKLGAFLLGLLLAAGGGALGQVVISNLPQATLPLTGNETVVMSQAQPGCPVGGCTVQGKVSNISPITVVPVQAVQGGTGEAGTITGIPFANGTSAYTAATVANITSLFTGCSGTVPFLTNAGSCSQVNLATQVTGILPSVNGGTGEAGTFTGVRKANTLSPDTAALISDILALASGTCSATTFLSGSGACGTSTPGATFTVGGAIIGTPTGGAQGAGTLNMTGCFVNGVACSVAGGSVSSISAGTGITLTPSPITTTGSVALTVPVVVSSGGTGDTTLPVHGVLLGEGTAAVGNVAAMAVDTLLQGKGATIDPAAVAVNNCGSASQALSYSTTTHTFGCQTISVGGTPGGATTDMQYNNAGVFGGAANFTYNSATGGVAVTTPTSGTALAVSGISGNDTAVFDSLHTGTNVGITTGSNIYVGSSINLNIGTTTSATGALNLSTGATVREAINAAGNVTINAPSSGAALTVNGVASASLTSSPLVVLGSSTTGQSNGLFIAAGTNASDNAIRIQNQAQTQNYFILEGNGSGNLGPTGGTGIGWTAAGNVTLNAPSSGQHEIDGFGQSTSVVLGFQASGTTAGWLQFNDKTNANAVRGYEGFGSSLFTGAAITDFGLAAATGGRLLFSSNSGGTTHMYIGASGGEVVGAPTGGDKGTGSINVQTCFVNGVACSVSAGGAQIASTTALCTSGGCTAVNAKGISTTITRNSTGNYTITFSPAFSAQPACAVSPSGTVGGIGTFTFGGTTTGTVITYVAAVATDMNWSAVCSG
jgi:hypothetical protein